MRTVDGGQIINAIRHMCVEACCVIGNDVRDLLEKASQEEVSELGRYSLDKIIANYKIAEQKRVAVCQDTGIVVVLAEIGCEAHISGGTLQELVDEGVRQGYAEGYLRMSMVKDPLFDRRNTGDNTPSILHIKSVPGDKVKLTILPKGAGSENMSALKMLSPSSTVEDVSNFVLQTVESAGGNPCPPIIVGVGIGGTSERAILLAKEALAREAGCPSETERYAILEQNLLKKINALGIGPQGFGGKVTALAVHVNATPTHIAMLPVAVNINCHAARHCHALI